MSLNKIIHPLIVDGGINTKIDEKLVSAGENLVVENASYNTIGNLEKRNGFEKLTENVEEVLVGVPLTTTDINPQFLIEHNNELLMGGSAGESGIYSLSDKENKWLKKEGQPLSPFVFTEDDFSSRYSVTNPQSVECPNYGVRYTGFIYSDATLFNGIVIYKQDLVTNSKKIIFQSNVSASSSVYQGFRLDVIDTSIGGLTEPFLFITIIEGITVGATYRLQTWGYSDENYVFVSTLTSGRTTVPYFDSCLVGDDLCVMWHESSVVNPHKVISIEIVTQLGVHAGFNYTMGTAYNSSIGALSVCYDPVNSLILMLIGTNVGHPAAGNDNVVSVYMANSIGTYLAGPSYLTYGSNGDVFDVLKIISTTINETPILDDDVTFSVAITYSYSFDNSGNTSEYTTDETKTYNVFYTKSTQTLFGGDAIDYPTFYGSIASKFWRISGNDDAYFIGQSTITNNMSYFILRYSLSNFPTFPTLNPDISNLGSFAINKATFDKTLARVELARNYELPIVSLSNDGNYYYPSAIINRTLAIAGATTVASYLPVSILSLKRIEFESEYNGISAKLGENTYIAGASVKEYDGEKLMEQGFYQFPEFFLSAEAPPIPTNDYDGTYSYRAIFEYIDSNGQIHRSAPTPQKSIVIAGKLRYVTISNPFRYIKGSKILDSQEFYAVILYRTTDGGTSYYRLTNPSGLTNVFYAPYIKFEDVTSDADIQRSEPLYTNGDVLENETVAPLKYLIAANNRIFGLSSEDENLLAYSQEHKSGEAVNFSNALTMRLDGGVLNRSGISMALACLDSKIVILKDQSIIYFYGNGPNDTGAQNDYSDPKIISSDVGLRDIKSLVTIPDGLIFKSNKGFYLLDRSLQLSYIGYPVEAYNDEKIIGTSNVVDEHKVLFMSSSRTIAYDYLSKKWSTWTITGNYLTTYKKLPIYIKNKKIYYQNKSLFKDDTNYQSLKMVTPWIKLVGVQNFQRVYKVILLGEFKSAHTLTVKFYRDYDETAVETHIISPLITDKIYQYQINPVVQKCQSMKIEIFDNINSGTGQGFVLSNITLVLGKKEGVNKLDNNNSY